jgi:hypothetical protein
MIESILTGLTIGVAGASAWFWIKGDTDYDPFFHCDEEGERQNVVPSLPDRLWNMPSSSAGFH